MCVSVSLTLLHACLMLRGGCWWWLLTGKFGRAALSLSIGTVRFDLQVFFLFCQNVSAFWFFSVSGCITINGIIGTCVCVFVIFFSNLRATERQIIGVDLFVCVCECVCDLFIGGIGSYLYQLFFFLFYLFSVSLITTQLKHQSSYSRTMFMYISASFMFFLFSHSVHVLSAHELASIQFPELQVSVCVCKLRCILFLLLLYRLGQSRISVCFFFALLNRQFLLSRERLRDYFLRISMYWFDGCFRAFVRFNLRCCANQKQEVFERKKRTR